MSGIIGSKLNHRGSGLIGSLGTDGQHFLSSGAGKTNVFETAAATDLTPVRQDILTLGLKQAVQENSTKFNLPNSSICKFEADADFNLSGSTTVARNASEYISAMSASTGAFTTDSNTKKLYHMEDNSDSSASTATITLSGTANFVTTQYKFGAKSYYQDGANSNYAYVNNESNWAPGTGALTVELWVYLENGGGAAYAGVFGDWWHGTTNYFDMRPATADCSDNFGLLVGGSCRDSGQAIPDDAWHHLAWTRDGSGNNTLWYDGVSKVTFSDSTDLAIGTHSFKFGATDNATAYLYEGYIDEVRLSNIARYSGTFTPNQTLTQNATGTALGTTNVPTSGVTEVSGVFLNKDTSGATTLGTDVKAYFTADNSNWTEATSYADAGTFSDTTKMIKLGKTTVTSGSDVRWKIVWANQSAGSKVSNIYGIGLNY